MRDAVKQTKYNDGGVEGPTRECGPELSSPWKQHTHTPGGYKMPILRKGNEGDSVTDRGTACAEVLRWQQVCQKTTAKKQRTGLGV